MIFVPTDLGARVGGPTPTGPKSSLLESEAFRKIWPPPLAASLALVETSCPVRVPPEVGSFVESATVMFADPLKATPLIEAVSIQSSTIREGFVNVSCILDPS